MNPRPTVTPENGKRRRIATVVRDRTLVKQRRDQIVRAAIEVFTRFGYDRATVREVAEAAGLSSGTLYCYIRAKEDLLYLVFDKLISTKLEEVCRAVEGIDDPAERARAAIHAEIEVAHRHRDEVLLLYRESHSLDHESLREVMDRESEYARFLDGMLDGDRRAALDGDAALSGDVLLYLSSMLALRWWRLRDRFTSEQATDALAAFVARGLGMPEKGVV